MTREERAKDYAEHNIDKYTNDFANLYNAYLKGAKEETKELEQENAKLEEDLARYKLKVEALEGKTPWKDIKDKSEVIGKLSKAKELLREYIRINLLPPIERKFDDEVKLFKQAEQFLIEVK